MGTNYYLISKEKATTCECCGSPTNLELHIGKSSYGWQFSFMSYPNINIVEFKDWENLIKDSGNYSIKDEYDRTVPPNYLLELINDKQKDKENKSHVKEEKNGYMDSAGYNFSTTEFS